MKKRAFAVRTSMTLSRIVPAFVRKSGTIILRFIYD